MSYVYTYLVELTKSQTKPRVANRIAMDHWNYILALKQYITGYTTVVRRDKLHRKRFFFSSEDNILRHAAKHQSPKSDTERPSTSCLLGHHWSLMRSVHD